MIYRNYIFNTLSIFLLLISVTAIIVEAKDGSPVIARVGTDSITVEQFVGLFELNPRIQNSNSTSLTAARIDFLHTLIGNKLWSQYRNRKGLDTTLAEHTANSELSMMFTLDYLYRKKILEEAEPTKEELEDGFVRATKTLLVNYIFTVSKEEINNLYDLLNQGFAFEEILSARDENKSQHESLEINFDDYEEEVEDELYNLNAKKYSRPIHLEDGYYIFYLSNVLTKHYMDEKSREEQIGKLKEILRRRNENKVYNAYMKSVLSGKEVVINKSLKDDLIKTFDKRKHDNLFTKIIDDSTFVLSATDVLDVETILGKQALNNVLLKMDTLKVTLKDYIRALVFNHSKIIFKENSSKEYIESNLSDYMRKLILYEEAKKLKYDLAIEVQNDLKIWTEYFTFESVRASIADTVNITNKMITKAGEKIFESTSDSTFLQGESQTELIRNRLIDRKVSRILKDETAELAKDIKIKINYGLLQSLETSHINSFAIRRLGFGGSFPAVPIYFPNSQWVNPSNYKRFILP